MAEETEREECEDSFEVLNVADKGKLTQYLGELSKASTAKQLTVGGVSGWTVGFVSSKVGRTAALGLGSGLLILQIAHYKGFIKINWSKVEKDMEKAKRKARKDAEFLPRLAEEIKEYVSQNVVVAGGFAAGFLIGLAC